MDKCQRMFSWISCEIAAAATNASMSSGRLNLWERNLIGNWHRWAGTMETVRQRTHRQKSAALLQPLEMPRLALGVS